MHFLQLREKSLEAGALLQVAEAARAVLDEVFADPNSAAGHARPRLLVNSRLDVAVAARADGVHLTSRPGELTPRQARQVFAVAGLGSCLVSISCHTPEEAAAARDSGADLILFGPVFEKRVGGLLVAPGTGLARLRVACAAAAPTPVLALGGLDPANLPACLGAGAAGVAGIRLFAHSA